MIISFLFKLQLRQRPVVKPPVAPAPPILRVEEPNAPPPANPDRGLAAIDLPQKNPPPRATIVMSAQMICTLFFFIVDFLDLISGKAGSPSGIGVDFERDGISEGFS